jgi:hypothetical protein
MISTGQINLELIQAEIKAVFDRYETALVNNDLDMLDKFFWHNPLVVRFGIAENLYGIEAIRAFRKSRSTTALKRDLMNTIITTYGADFATTTTEFVRENKVEGRQSQTWVRLNIGWRIVSAHVSFISQPA